MKSTGIFRRIDELGRIVIPKELRKTLRLQTGDNLEIYLNEESIILKKFSFFKGIGDYAQILCDTFNNNIKKNIIICDTNCIIASSSLYKKDIINTKISSQLLNFIINRANCSIIFKDNLDINDKNVFKGRYIVNTIVVNGDAIGIIIIFSDNITEKDQQIIKILSDLIEKQIEN